MKLLHSTCLIVLPLCVNSWSVGRPSLFISPVEDTLLSRLAYMNEAKTKTRSVSPRYEILDNDTSLSISLDVPGVKLEDIDVTVEGKVLSIKGRREQTGETGSTFSSRFSQSFSLDPTVDPDHFTAKLDNGVLIVTAPKDLSRIEKNIRRIPITQGPTFEQMKNSDIDLDKSEPEAVPSKEPTKVESDAGIGGSE